MGIVNNYLNEVRHEFASQELSEQSVCKSPIEQLEKWVEEAVDSQILEPNAMVVSTVNGEGQPSSRVVYLRGLDANGLRFYTNYNSQKGQDIEVNSNASVLFFYSELERQVRVEGRIEKLSDAESDAYFNARPVESKLGAWASNQSSKLKDRDELVVRLEKYRKQFGNEVPRPPHWGGYCLVPNRVEFWQGRPARLHDRIIYELEGEVWNLYRVAP
jgi:pyridoxamine 5'-phosphate oxidase